MVALGAAFVDANARAPVKTDKVSRVKVSYVEDVVNHNGPESCGAAGEGVFEFGRWAEENRRRRGGKPGRGVSRCCGKRCDRGGRLSCGR